MDNLDKQLAELELISKGQLVQNPNAEVKPKKIAPAVPPKPKKQGVQIYYNLPSPGLSKSFEIRDSYCNTPSTYSNQDGLIYSNILHEPLKGSKTSNTVVSDESQLYSNIKIKSISVSEDLPPPPADIEPSPEYVQCDVPPPFPPPPIPTDDIDDDLPPPPPPIIDNGRTISYDQSYVGSNFTHDIDNRRRITEDSMYAPMGGSCNTSILNRPRKSPSPNFYPESTTHIKTGYGEMDHSSFAIAGPQVVKNKPSLNPSISDENRTYSNIRPVDSHTLDRVRCANNHDIPTYENTSVSQNIDRESTNGSVLDYPGSSVSDYENQPQMFRYTSDTAFRSNTQNESNFRPGSSASNYPRSNYENRVESVYAPLRRPNSSESQRTIVDEKAGLPNLPSIITCSTNDSSNVDDLPAPASPVSSSYSELRRATDHDGHDIFNPYAPGSNVSSTYESIYEPINPRPPSQASARSSYSLYNRHPNISNPTIMNSTLPLRSKQSNEIEVDQLTDLLVQGLDPNNAEDLYGVCVKCNEKIIGEENGCTAMEKFYHVDCFTCCQCNINLQGKPFYSLDGNPYCEQDYLNTLEKCCVCMKPILDRILRATGKPYHPQCFTCVVCDKSLDGIQFTVDATNQIHCIEDFHKKFAPRCCVCKLPIMPESGQEETVRVVALDRSFHVGCYKCEDCGLVLSSEAEGRGCYPLDDHVLCKNCNAKRVQALTSHMTTEL